MVRVVVVLAFGAVVAGCNKPVAKVAASKPPEVLFDRPTTKTVTDYEDFTGRTEAIATIDMRARVTGYLEKAFFRDGADVKQGEVLFEIDPRTYQAELDRTDALVKQNEAGLSRATLDFERETRMYKKGVVPKEEYDKSLDVRLEAEATLASARAMRATAALNFGFTKVISPVTGRISRRLVDPGNLVKADDTLLTTIVSVDPMYAYFDIDERTMLRLRRLRFEGKIKSSREKDLVVQIGLADEEGFSLTGTINFVDNRVDATTGTLRVRAAIPNAKGFVSPGQFVRIRLPVGSPHDSIVVPEQALGTDQGVRFLYVLNDKDEVVYRKVKVGQLNEGNRVIESGISTSDRVIVSGIQRVRPGSKATPKQAGAVASDKKAPDSKAVKDEAEKTGSIAKSKA
jgi:RND family efflux transporter MFP subunit